MGGLFREHGDAEADQPAVRFAALLPGPDRRKADRLDRLVQKLRVVAAVEMLVGDVVERHLVGTDQICEPDLVGLLADLPRDRVDHQLHGVADVRPRDAAIGQLRAFVGDDRGGLAAIDRNVIRARQDGADLRGLDRGGERVGRIGAGIDRRLGVERQEFSLLVGIGRDRVVMFAAVGVGGQLFAPVLKPADRMTAPHRQPAQADFLAGEDRLVAEASAHVGRDHANLDFGNLQDLRQPGADDMRETALRRAGSID